MEGPGDVVQLRRLCVKYTIAHKVLVGAGYQLSYNSGFLFGGICEEWPSDKAELMRVADLIIIYDEQFMRGSAPRMQGSV